MRCIFFFTFIVLASHSYAIENELPKISKHSDAIVSPIHAQLVQHAPTSFFSKVNPITGEYVEEETDLEVPGCEPLSFRRFYGHFNPPDPRYGGWRINPETSLVANFQWKKSRLFAAVGEENGSVTFLGDCQGATVDGHSVLSYCLDQQNPDAYTNLGSSDPHNMKLYFWPEYGHEGKSRYRGYIQDGSGKKREFASVWHNWHEDKRVHLEPRTWVANAPPQNWIPYELIVEKEILPNGNVIIYQTRNWQDEIHWPHPRLLTSIVAYNSDQTKKLGSITITYDTYNWRFTQYLPSPKEPVKYKESVWEVAQYTVEGSHKKKVLFCNSRRDKPDYPILLSSVHDQDRSIKYNCTKDYCLNYVDKGDGRIFQTEYDPQTHKVTCQKGPYGEIARYAYHHGFTEAYDAENNKSIFRYDQQKRLTSIEKADSIERFIWDKNSRLLAKTLEGLDGKVLYKQSFTYDSDHQGHVIEETLTGDLTGSGQEESYTLYRTYDKEDPFHLKRSEYDDLGKMTYYTYKPNTNLLETETVYDKETPLFATSYQYDDCAVCIKKTVEDYIGSYKRITLTHPLQESICFGLPQIIEEKMGEETLLSKSAYVYHCSGKIEKETRYDALGHECYTLSNVYDPHDRLVSSKDPYGHETTYKYDTQDNLISQNGPLHHITWEYDLENRPIKEIHTGLEKRFVYDRLGRIKTFIDECGNSTHYTYNALGRVIAIQHPDGGIEKKDYDIFGNVTQETDQNGFCTLKKYNIRNQPTHIYYPDGTEEHFLYHLNGTLAEHIDKNRCKTVFTYDVLNHPLKEETYSPEGHLLTTKTATWSVFNKLSETDENGVTTFFAYDSAGRKISEQKENLHITFIYDALGRLSRIEKPFTTTVHEYDYLNQLIEQRTEDPHGKCTFQEKYLYDAEGNKTHTMTCQGATQTHYNAHKLPTQIIDPEGHVTEFTYTYTDCFTKITTDPDGIFKIETHDPCKRLKSVQTLNRQGMILQHREFAYDLAGNRIQATEHIYEGINPVHTLATSFTYGPCNRLEKISESDLKETQYFYDPQGKLRTILKPDQTAIHHTYDALGRLHTLKADKLDYTYSYDKKGRVTSIFDGKTTTSRVYDHFDHLLEEKLANGYHIKYCYDDEGKLIQLHLPEGIATFAYQANRLQQVSYKGLTTTYTRNLHGKPTCIDLPSNLGSVRIEYDSSLNIKNLLSPYFSALDYQYDPTGHLLHYVYTDALGPVTSNYVYDDLHQLILENEHTYAYDSLSNRIVKDELRHTLNTLSQVTNDGKTTYAYDANGNLIQAGDIRFAYDALDRLTHVYKKNATYEYVYDPFNRRITKKTPSEKIHYLWQEKNEIGSSKGELRILGDGLGAEIGAAVFIQLNQKMYIPFHDQRGALTTLIDLKGKPVETIRYTAFGEEISTSKLSPWRFCSKRRDEETGYLYFGRRFYAPSLGRWISPDPRGFEDGPNLYAYVHNAPLLDIDLYGEWAIFRPMRDFGYRMGSAALDFTFPCATALYRLPANAPMWQRGALAFGAVGEAALLFVPPVKMGVSLAEKSVFQIGNSAMARQTERQLMRSAGKTASVAAERKIVQNSQSSVQAGKQLILNKGRNEVETWRFPNNPNELLKDLPRDRKGRIYTSDNLRIRPEKHHLNQGDAYNPRHHGQHYHIETRRNSNLSWENYNNIEILKPSHYKPGEGTGFIPGEPYPGIDILE